MRSSTRRTIQPRICESVQEARLWADRLDGELGEPHSILFHPRRRTYLVVRRAVAMRYQKSHPDGRYVVIRR